MDKWTLTHYVNAYKKGDADAFRVLYEETKSRAYYTILLIVKNQEVAADLLQDTYMKVVDKIHTYESGTHFSAWVNTIARNLALTHFKNAKRETIQDVQESEALFGSHDDQIESQTYIAQLMKHLDAEAQEIVIRHVVMREKHKDIAIAMDKPLGTITWKYNEAIKRLKKVADHEKN